MSESKQSLLVVGAGTMGAGIAQIAAAAGWKVFLHDQIPHAAGDAIARVSSSLNRARSKGYVSQADCERTLSNLQVAESLSKAAAVDVVIEAVKEDLSVKQAVFRKLDQIAGPSVPLWSNTSMLSITQIAEGLRHPERVAGTHFFNPVPRMQLVEVIAGEKTGADTVALAESLLVSWGKTPVLAPDSPGFIVNRILDAIKREALSLLDEGVSADRVDTAVRLGLNFPMGPFELMDLVGLDTTLDCLINQARAMKRPPEFSPKLTGLVSAGNLGRKTGSGFYRYVPQD